MRLVAPVAEWQRIYGSVARGVVRGLLCGSSRVLTLPVRPLASTAATSSPCLLNRAFQLAMVPPSVAAKCRARPFRV